MLSGTRSALAPCRPGPFGARMAWAPFSDGLRDFGEVMAAVFAYGMIGAAVSARSGQTAPKMRVHSYPVSRSALPADTRFVPEPHLDFLAAHRIGQVGLYLGGKVSKRLPGLRVGFRAGAPKGAETRARQTTCLPCVPASSHPSAFRPRVADRHAASRQHRAFPNRGLRGRARQAPQDLPHCSDGGNPVAAGSPSRSLRLPTCGRRPTEPMRPPPYAARPWHHGSGSRQHGVPLTSNPSA